MFRRRSSGFLVLALGLGLLGNGAAAFAATPQHAPHRVSHASAAADPAGAPAAGTPAGASVPSVRLMTPSTTIRVLRFPGQPIYVDPGVYLASVGGAFQVNLSRSDYDHAPAGTQIIDGPSGTTTRPLPSAFVRSLDGLTDFFHVVVRNHDGAVVTDQMLSFCPSGTDQRTDSSGPANPTYPRNCFSGPFTLGSVIGIDAGWAISALGYTGINFDGKNGNYTARIAIAKPYREFFGVSSADAISNIKVNVRKDTTTCQPFCPGAGGRVSSTSSTSRGLTAAPDLAAPKPWTVPDLVALPGWGATITSTDGHDYLEFAATIWNRGPQPLVVEGFRNPGEPKMKAWQYFYNAAGEVVGRARVGSFHYDARPGHEHWHFEQFARYSLLDANQQRVVLSQKEAFCLAPTDAIDMTTKGAQWNPQSIGLATACGGQSAIWVREVLPAGWGDTYIQSLPGQSFDITSLPNGTYFISVEANPDGALFERTRANNTELREVNISGTTGHRHVHMLPWHGITA